MGSLVSDQRDNFGTGGNAVPAGKPSEEVLLAWFDGELAAAEQARLTSIYPELARMVARMRADAGLVRSLGLERAPEAICGRVMDVLEREALVGTGLESGVEQVAEAPVSFNIETIRASRTQTVEGARSFGHGWYALAAGVALLVSGGVYLSTMTKVGTKTATPAGVGPMLAKTDARAFEKPGVSSETGGELKIALAPKKEAMPSEAGLRSAGATGVSSGVTPAVVTPGAPDPIVIASNASAAPVDPLASITPEQAIALAREGRLVVRVYANDARSLAKIERSHGHDNAENFRLMKDVPSNVIAAVVPVRDTSGFSADRVRERQVIADSETGSARAIDRDSLPRSEQPVVVSPIDLPGTGALKTYLADLQGTVEAFAAMQASFEDGLKGTAEFDILDTPLALQLPEDPDSILWWMQAPSEWAVRFVVPVVVEAR